MLTIIAFATLLLFGCTEPSVLPEDALQERWALPACERGGDQPEAISAVIKGEQTGPCLLAVRPAGLRLSTDSADPVLPVRRMSDGRFVAPTSFRDRFGIWSSDGTEVSLFGSRGQGPGEVQTITAVYVFRGDTLFVSDSPEQFEVFTADGEWVRGASGAGIAHYEAAALLDSGDFLLAPPNHTNGGMFAILDGATGRYERTIGTLPVRAEGSRQFERPIAYNGGDTFWAASTDGYTLEHWHLDGRRLGRIEREVSWFPYQPQTDPDENRPYVATLALDDDDILWVAVIEHATSSRPRSIEERPDIDALRDFDLHVEAFDTRTGALLYSELFDDPYLFMPPPFYDNGYAARIHPDENGVIQLDLVQYKLVARPQ